jgi:hypothetical protein
MLISISILLPVVRAREISERLSPPPSVSMLLSPSEKEFRDEDKIRSSKQSRVY